MLLLCVLSLHSQVRAEGPRKAASASDAEARTLFERGRAAYELGDFEKSLSYFQEAYELSGRAELLFNIGQAADRLRKDRVALEAFERYLAARPNADNRREVENRVRALEATLEAQREEPAQGQAAETSDGTDGRKAPRPQPARKGFYAQAAVGFGGLHDSLDAVGEPTLTGTGVAFDVGAGYGIAKGLAIGGLLTVEVLAKPKLEVGGKAGERLESATVATIGPVIDWYPLATENGFHVLGSLAFSSLSKKDQQLDATSESKTASGGGFILGAGYEWAFQRDVAFGALLRVSGATLREDDATHKLGSIALLASATWF